MAFFGKSEWQSLNVFTWGDYKQRSGLVCAHWKTANVFETLFKNVQSHWSFEEKTFVKQSMISE